jgi:tetratricopeptide (TPR) repeat protein
MKGMNMKSVCLVILAILAVPAVHGQAPLGAMTPAQQKISWAQAAIKENPDRSQPYNDLALGYLRRVRETADASYYDRAETALQKSLQISPDNFEAQKTRIMVLLGRREFAEALESAKALSRKMPDDVQAYGMVADADLGLGNYKDAEQAAQWMLDLRPGNIPGLLRGARLRQTFGDAEGAMDFYSQSYQQTPPTQTEDLAWILTQMAGLDLSSGNIVGADKLLRSALEKFPNYYLALESQARVRIAQLKATEAVKLLRKRNQNFPSVESQYAFAKALEAAGQAAEADTAFAEFERIARGQIDVPKNANLVMAQYYLGRGKKTAEALRIARIEIARRHDVETLDEYAWALYANGQYREAQKEIATALAVGVREASFFFHAGAIAARLNDGVSAARYLDESLQLNPASECAGHVREELEKLHPASATSRRQE